MATPHDSQAPARQAAAVDGCIIALYRAARDPACASFEDAALDCIRGLAPFDYACWSRAALDGGIVRLYAIHDRLPEGALAVWRSLEERDVLGALAFANLGKTINASPARAITDDPVIVREVIEAFDAEHFLTTCLVDPDTALVSSITLIRRKARPGFSEQERRLKERLTPHMVEALAAHRLLRLMERRGAAGPYPYAAAICDGEGLLEFAAPEFVELVRQEWPGWTGPRLPAGLPPAAGQPGRQVLDRVTVRAEPAGSSVLVRIRERQPVDSLSPREAEVARFSALGRSNKEIAQALELSPFTVRNQLESVYRKLGIAKRGELGALLGELGEDAG